MSTKRSTIGCAIAVVLGTQALALSSLAQQPDYPRDRPTRDTMPASPTTDAQPPGTYGTDRSAMKNTKSVSAQSFATQAATIGKAEIELAQLALKNSDGASVKKYAQRMVKDHTAADAKLKTIAANENLALPRDLDAEHKAVKDKLAAMKGDEFDNAYAAEMAKGHDKAVALFESASQTAAMPEDLKQFAASTLPTLKEHKEMAHSLHGKEGA